MLGPQFRAHKMLQLNSDSTQTVTPAQAGAQVRKDKMLQLNSDASRAVAPHAGGRACSAPSVVAFDSAVDIAAAGGKRVVA